MDRSQTVTRLPSFPARPLWLAVWLLVILVLAQGALTSTAQGPLVRGEELTFKGTALGVGTHDGTGVAAEGLTLLARSGIFVSAEIAAPIGFTDVGALWIVDQPPGTQALLELRTSADGDQWTTWQQVDAEEALKQPDDEETMGDLTTVPRADGLHRYVQVRWTLTAGLDGESPLLRRLRLAFIDASQAPRFESTATTLTDDSSLAAYLKPAVVSRTQWGCPDGQNSPDWPPEYFPVSHIVVHHTATSQDTTVLAIWYYHAITRDWGDIGYNYLVDKNGVLYEGRAGGDDVIAGHAYPLNVGTLGVSFIGNFTADPVPLPMFESMAELLAWKADQKGISPHDWAWIRPQDYPTYPEAYLPRFMGHRDVPRSATTCPGDVLYAQIPLLRDEVAARLEPLDYLLADELDPAVFEKSSSTWYDGPSGCGYSGHAYWTFSTTDANQISNWGRWRPYLPKSGAYRIYAYVPYCINGYPDSAGVYYQIHHALGDTTVRVNQETGAGGWVDLGVFNFSAGTDGYVYLRNLAVDTNRTVWFDTFKWLLEDDGGVTLPPTNLAPANGSWSTSRTVAFRWSASPSDGVYQYWIRIAADAGLSTIIKSDSIDFANQDYDYTFGTDRAVAYWGVQALGPDGYSATSGPWKLGVDTVKPVSAVTHIFTYPDGRYSAHWSGTDSTSGVATYDIEYRVGSSDLWIRWLTNTPVEGAYFPYPINDVTYFRSRATDRAGNVGYWDSGQTNTANALLLDRALWFAIVFH